MGSYPEVYPEVLAYEDKILRIEGIDDAGADIMYVPYEAYQKANNAFSKDPGVLDDFLRSVVPVDTNMADK